jgi:hypothetical protein
MISQLISSFNSGEWSPYLEARTNLEKYRNSCKVLENMVITPYGPANRRAGTEYLGAAKLSGTRCRLIGLDISDTNHIVMELGVGYIRFWKNGALITSGGTPVEATQVNYLNAATGVTPVHPYQEADLRAVQVCQINDLIYLTHPSHPPQRLSRLSDTNWTVGEVPFGDPSIPNNWAPMLDQNVKDITINPSSSSIFGTLLGVTFAYSSTTVTATKAGHNLTEGQGITVSGATGASGAAYNGTWVVDEVVSSSQFKFIVTTAPTANSSGTVFFEIAAQVGETITLAASSGIFQAGHVGSYWELAHPNSTTFISQNIDATNATSTTIKILGKWSLQTFGTWTAQVDLQASTDNGTTWKTARTYKSNGDFNTTSSGEEQVETLFRLRVRGFKATGTSTTPRIMLSPLDPTLRGLVRITGYTSPTQVEARVLKSLGGTGVTSQWREGAFSAVQGYPAALALHDSRIIFAGTSSNPSSLWGSYSNDFQNFKQGAYDADSWFFTLASTTGGQIQWLLSKSALLIGTTLDEWSMSSSDQTRPITPTNVNVRQQSHYGSSSLGAQIVNDTLLYVQRMNRKIREMDYTFSSENWVSNDITALAEHTTRTGIVETSYQRVPDAILWFVRGDGQLVSMTYEREQQVVGFARHITDGVVESVATLNGTNAEDEVWLLVRRTIGGATVRYVERLKLGMRDALDTADKNNWWYVDSGVLRTFGSPTSTITGLSHLEGKAVSVWADNAVGSLIVSQPTVVGGQITLQTPASRVLVGLPFTSTLVPQRVDTNLQDGTSQGRRMRIPRINLKVYQSTGGELSTDGVNWFPLVSRTLTDVMDSSPPVLNGYERAYASSNWADGVDLYVRQTQPVPFTVAALVVNFEVSEATQN